jgi:hypothetical protein
MPTSALGVKPEELGLRITYLLSPPGTKESIPYRDMAVPFAVER